MIALQVGALVAVAQQELAAVVVVGVLDEDERVAEVGQLEQDLVLDLVELARVDLVVPVRSFSANEKNLFCWQKSVVKNSSMKVTSL